MSILLTGMCVCMAGNECPLCLSLSFPCHPNVLRSDHSRRLSSMRPHSLHRPLALAALVVVLLVFLSSCHPPCRAEGGECEILSDDFSTFPHASFLADSLYHSIGLFQGDSMISNCSIPESALVFNSTFISDPIEALLVFPPLNLPEGGRWRIEFSFCSSVPNVDVPIRLELVSSEKFSEVILIREIYPSREEEHNITSLISPFVGRSLLTLRIRQEPILAKNYVWAIKRTQVFASTMLLFFLSSSPFPSTSFLFFFFRMLEER